MRQREQVGFPRTGHGIALASALLLLGTDGRAQPYFQAGYLTSPWTPALPVGASPTAWPVLTRPAGDWNGDGWPDFAVRWASSQGLLRVHSGWDFSVVTQVAAPPVTPPYSYDMFGGFDFADFDGDSILDLALGILPGSAGSSNVTGMVVVLLGPLLTPSSTVLGANLGDNFGNNVVVVGDTSGNGISDFLVHAPGYPTPLSLNTGAVYLIEGADGSVRNQYLGNLTGLFSSGTVFASLGDIDADGFPDFAIARPPWSDLYPCHLEIYSGLTPSVLIREHVATFGGEGHCAGALFSTGDGDGDGIPEYVIGNAAFGWQGTWLSSLPGRAWLYSGADGSVIATYVAPPNAGQLGAAGSTLEDLDGDGFREILIGSASVSINPPISQGIHVFHGASGTLLQSLTNPYYPTSSPDLGQLNGTLNHPTLSFVGGVNIGPTGSPALLLFDRGFVTVSPNPVPIGSTATFSASLSTEPGALYHLFMASGTSQGIPIGSRRFALDPDPVFWTTAALPSLTATLDSAGSASISIPVPPNPALSGVTLFFAGVTIDPAYPYSARTLGTARWLTIQ